VLTDVRTGDFVAYPEVRFTDLETNEEYRFIGDENGRFDFRIPAGHYSISIQYENYYSSANDVWLEAAEKKTGETGSLIVDPFF
jgi:hypothetical protein